MLENIFSYKDTIDRVIDHYSVETNKKVIADDDSYDGSKVKHINDAFNKIVKVLL